MAKITETDNAKVVRRGKDVRCWARCVFVAPYVEVMSMSEREYLACELAVSFPTSLRVLTELGLWIEVEGYAAVSSPIHPRADDLW